MNQRDELNEVLSKQAIDREALLNIVPQLNMLKCSQHHPAHTYDVFEHTIKVVEKLPSDAFLRTLALFHDIGKPSTKDTKEDGFEHFWGHEKAGAKIAENLLRDMGYKEPEICYIKNFIKIHDIKIEPTYEKVKEKIGEIGIKQFETLITLQEADLLAHSEPYIEEKMPMLNNIKDIFQQIKKENK